MTSNVSTPTSSKLDSASKDDLIKLLKKQQLILKKTKEEHENQKEKLDNIIDELKSESEDYNQTIFQLKKENEDLYSYNNRISSQKCELESTIQRLNNDLDDLNTNVAVLKSSKERMGEEYTRIQDEVNVLKSTISTLKVELETERVERERERSAWKSHINELQQLQSDAEKETGKKEKSQVTDISSELIAAKDEILSLRSDGLELKELFEQYNLQFQEEANNISQLLEVIKNPNAMRSSQELSNTIEESKVALEQKDQIIEQLKIEISELNAQINSNHRDGDQHPENTDYTAEITELKDKVEHLEEEKRRLTGHMERFIDDSSIEQNEEAGMDEARLLLEEKDHIIEDLTLRVTNAEDELSRVSEENNALQQRVTQLLEESSEKNRLVESLQETTGELEAQVSILRNEGETLKSDIETERNSLQSQNFIFEEQIKELTAELEEEALKLETVEHSNRETGQLLLEKTEQVTQLQQQLEEALENNKKLVEETQGSHNLMDMELADYQRAATGLKEKLNSSLKQIEQLQESLKLKEEYIEKCDLGLKEAEKQKATHEEMTVKLKGLLLKSKKDVADAKKEEEEAKDMYNKTKHQLEDLTQQFEDLKLDFSDATSTLQRVKNEKRNADNEKDAKIKNLENKILDFQDEVQAEKLLRAEISTDFENYKVRVHSVLKQQRSSSDNTVTRAEHEAIVAQLSKDLEMKKCELHEQKMQCETTTRQKNSVEEEFKHVLSSLEKLEKDSTEREKFYLERVGQLEELAKTKDQQLYTALQTASSQRTALTESYTKTLEHTTETHKEAVQMLESRISGLEEELERMRDEIKTDNTIRPQTTSHTPELQRPKIRIGAEGMENPDASYGFEDLLNNPNLSRSSSKLSFEVQQDDSKVDHMRHLLSESEHNAAALQEQCAVLKSEVRRLEAMVNRDTTNIEYLKNIVFKYLTTEDTTARERLVPVLVTVLRLTREEQQQLTAHASLGRREQVPWTSSWFSSS